MKYKHTNQRYGYLRHWQNAEETQIKLQLTWFFALDPTNLWFWLNETIALQKCKSYCFKGKVNQYKWRMLIIIKSSQKESPFYRHYLHEIGDKSIVQLCGGQK